MLVMGLGGRGLVLEETSDIDHQADDGRPWQPREGSNLLNRNSRKVDLGHQGAHVREQHDGEERHSESRPGDPADPVGRVDLAGRGRRESTHHRDQERAKNRVTKDGRPDKVTRALHQAGQPPQVRF